MSPLLVFIIRKRCYTFLLRIQTVLVYHFLNKFITKRVSLAPHLGHRGMERIMKILVIDDREINQVSARETLAHHEVTVAGSLEEGKKILFSPEGTSFEVALIDLDMPPLEGAEQMSYSQEETAYLKAQSYPFGWTLMIIASVLARIPLVAIVTGGNHHDSMGQAAFSLQGEHGIFFKKFQLGDGHGMFIPAPMRYLPEQEVQCKGCDGTGVCQYCRGSKILLNDEIYRGEIKTRAGEKCPCIELSAAGGECFSCYGAGSYQDPYIPNGKDWSKALEYLLKE